MFQGYSDETFEFFMAIRFNNNRDFFQGNHDWYVRGVRGPSLSLAEALAPAAEDLDGDFDCRPNRVVSRINRDIRFSNDKSPYRDYLWLAFRRPSEERGGQIGLYFDLSVSGGSYGMGFYNDNKPFMNALRRRIIAEPQKILDVWLPVYDEFALYANTYRRMNVPDGVTEPLRTLYLAKSFYFEKELTDFSLLKSPALADEIAGGYARLKPLYRYLREITPEADEDNTVIRP